MLKILTRVLFFFCFYFYLASGALCANFCRNANLLRLRKDLSGGVQVTVVQVHVVI